MKSTILIFRDRTHLQLQKLTERGITAQVVNDVHEARTQLDHLASFQGVVVDVQSDVERGLEFCEIVHLLVPKIPILFVRSAQRLSLAPHCAHRILDPNVSQDDLIAQILDLLDSDSTAERKPA